MCCMKGNYRENNFGSLELTRNVHLELSTWLYLLNIKYHSYCVFLTTPTSTPTLLSEVNNHILFQSHLNSPTEFHSRKHFLGLCKFVEVYNHQNSNQNLFLNATPLIELEAVINNILWTTSTRTTTDRRR